MRKTVSIVVPVYNEEDNIHFLVRAIQNVMHPLPYDWHMLLIDDGSTDETLKRIQEISREKTGIKYIALSRNSGHQAALKAGIDHCFTDCMISMDGDLQHPPALIPDMLNYWKQGFDVVYTIRAEQKQLPYFKRKTSALFYKMLGMISNLELEQGSADFRLLDRKVVSQLRALRENDLFIRGLVKWVGFRQKALHYQPLERRNGESKYSLGKMTRLALQGITSFSTKPLYLAAYIGLFFAFASLAYIPYALYSYWMGIAVSGWISLIVTVAFFGGLQLMILGIIGLYLGKLFMQSKGRPLYIIDKTNLNDNNHDAAAQF